jgi:hypothetical protein
VSAAELPRKTVSLEEGISVENPPCPVCGEPLFGWATLPLSQVPVRRCENCGIGIAGVPPPRDEVLATLSGSTRPVPNRSAAMARISASGWAGIDRDTKVVFSEDAVKRLGRTGRSRPALLLATQTLLNSFTFGHNVGLGLIGRGSATPAELLWQRRIDTAISVLASPVVLIAAAVLEGAGSLAGRGGALAIRSSDA